MTAATPWLSVLMPVFDGAAYVRDAVASVLQPGHAGIELVVVDDGSTDDTVARIEEEVGGRLPLTLLRRPHSGNWVEGTNLAMRVARGRHACVLHQDDLWLPGRAEAIRAALDDGAGCPALVTHDARFVGPAGEDLGSWTCPLEQGDCGAMDLLERLLVQNFLAMPSPVFERSAALEGGGLDESLWFAADWDLWLRMAARGGARHIRKPLAAFRIHAMSQTVARVRGARESRRQMGTVLARHLPSLRAGEGVRREVERAGRYSVEVNALLADYAAGGPIPWGLVPRFFALGPAGGHRYLRDSRIAERIRARLRILRA